MQPEPIKVANGLAYNARAESVYPLIEPGSVTMVWSDGPYAMGKGDWDKMKPSDLPAWYEPHIAAWSRLCAPSATVYHWGTAEGEGYVRDVYRRHGWAFRTLVVWEKTNHPVLRGDPAGFRCWPDVAEYCAVYQRCSATIDGPQSMVDQAIESAGNPCRDFICAEWVERGLSRKEADMACGVVSVASRHYFARSQWELPTWERYQALAVYADQKLGGHAGGRPAFVHPAVWPGGGLRSSYDHLRAEYDHLRAEYEASRVPFQLATGQTNIWATNLVGGSARLPHPCQKPLVFSRRAVLASSRPGDTVLDPFAGTMRTAAACASLVGTTDQRRHISIELDPKYFAAGLADVQRRGQQLNLL